MNVKDQVYFVLMRNGNPSYTFSGYTDKVTGEIKYIYKGRKDRNGNEIPHTFRFDRAHRTIRLHKDAVDIQGTNIANFLRDYNECGGSKNGAYVTGADGEKVQIGVRFVEVKEAEDAMVAIEAKVIKNKAENIALNLNGTDLREVALLCKVANEDVGIMKHHLVDYAGAYPATFMECYESTERKASALLLRAVDAKEVSVRGTIYKWGTVSLGSTYDLAVSKLVSDEEIAEALEEALKVKGNG